MSLLSSEIDSRFVFGARLVVVQAENLILDRDLVRGEFRSSFGFWCKGLGTGEVELIFFSKTFC